MPSPIVINNQIQIAAPPQRVWPFLVDWENLGRWMLEASQFRVISEHREGVGVEAEATIHIGFLKTTDRVRVDIWEPPNLLGIAHLGWVKGDARMSLEEFDDGTRLLWREELLPPWGIVGAIGLRLWKPMMRRVFERDMRVLRQLAER